MVVLLQSVCSAVLSTTHVTQVLSSSFSDSDSGTVPVTVTWRPTLLSPREIIVCLSVR